MGWVVSILAIVAIGNVGESCFAGCAHYVRDRLHPAANEHSSELAFGSFQPQDKSGLPCQGSHCQAPQLPWSPETVAIVVTMETSRILAVSVPLNWEFEPATRPKYDRPLSERIVIAPLRNILRPPC